MPELTNAAGSAAPRADRPEFPDGYGVPASAEGLLPWRTAEEILEQATLYWVSTTRPDGRPHAIPIWGAWVDGAFWFEGGAETRWARNLAANPAVAVHTERGDDVVMLEGTAAEFPHPDPALAARIADSFGAKYEASNNYRPDPASWENGGLYRAVPRRAFAWGHFPSDCTRWRLPAG